ncbi:MAG: hypothetical protein IPM98_06045 [Lewinellaceae bacterium]|nr:hypothetical protein [Lewinellaceae bacterium]
MRQLLLAACCSLLWVGLVNAQAISINTDGSNPDPSAILDVKSSDKGVLVPRMSTAQRTGIGAPAAGLLVFDTGTGSFWLYNGAAWTNLAAPNRIADADNDTRVQVEESPDEDAIRFDVGGTEALVVDSARNVGIGTPAPVEKLDVAGAIKIGNTGSLVPATGTIRWNDTTGDFEGFTGSQWKSRRWF